MEISAAEQEKIYSASKMILEADGILITAGAGIGVDSGIPDFRGCDGNINPSKEMIEYQRNSQPKRFLDQPLLAWGQHGHSLNLFRNAIPHDGFRVLKKLSEKITNGAFVVTSNVDGQFQKAGFEEDRIYEIHGTMHRLQCIEPSHGTWSAESFSPEVNAENGSLVSDIPRCPQCDGIARPNVLLFNDVGFNRKIAQEQQSRFDGWLENVNRLVTIEIGAGIHVTTIRDIGERLDGMIIRINPQRYIQHYHLLPEKGVHIEMGALKSLVLLDSAFQKLI